MEVGPCLPRNVPPPTPLFILFVRVVSRCKGVHTRLQIGNVLPPAALPGSRPPHAWPCRFL
jgi:hypothetical protein